MNQNRGDFQKQIQRKSKHPKENIIFRDIRDRQSS